jgi:hypothetical protein
MILTDAGCLTGSSTHSTVSRYVHLNPVRAGLVRLPEQWEWSSYPGYRNARRVQAWVAQDVLLAAWQGDQGGRDARRAYVRFVECGLDDPPPPPFRQAFGGWVLGSERFVARLRSHAGAVLSNPPVAEARQLAGLDPKRIFAAVAAFYGLDEAALSRRHDPHLARAVAAWLCRRYTEASLRELAKWLGLSRADSVPNLTRRLEARLKASPELSDDLTVRKGGCPRELLPEPCHGVRIEHRINTDDAHSLDHRLGDEQTVKRVAVMQRQRRQNGRVLDRDGICISRSSLTPCTPGNRRDGRRPQLRSSEFPWLSLAGRARMRAAGRQGWRRGDPHGCLKALKAPDFLGPGSAMLS